MKSPFKLSNASLKELGLDKLDPVERAAAVAVLEKRIDDIILKVALENLSREGFEALKVAISSANPEEEIAKVAALVPGLAEKIEERILAEYKMIRAVMA